MKTLLYEQFETENGNCININRCKINNTILFFVTVDNYNKVLFRSEKLTNLVDVYKLTESLKYIY